MSTKASETRLSPAERELVQRAQAAQLNAYAPYSKFRVGAALLCDSDAVYEGCNVENASLGLTICAERNAIATAVAQGARHFSCIAIATEVEPAAAPCGACRQVLAEFAPDLRVLLVGTGGRVTSVKLKTLLPRRFSGDRLAGRA